jgi:hypothetical protein
MMDFQEPGGPMDQLFNAAQPLLIPLAILFLAAIAYAGACRVFVWFGDWMDERGHCDMAIAKRSRVRPFTAGRRYRPLESFTVLQLAALFIFILLLVALSSAFLNR